VTIPDARKRPPASCRAPPRSIVHDHHDDDVEIIRGEASIARVCSDILALTKLNYNACIFADGEPVTLKFADAVGEILTAGPLKTKTPPLPFKYYI
jgi:hypothetical protein